MNKVVLMGRLTRDPEVRYSNSDTPMAITRYALAVRRAKTRANESEADFINVVAFGKNGEYAEKYFSKGQMVSIAGRIHQDTWEDQEHVKHSKFEIIADEQYSMGRKSAEAVKASDHAVESEIAAVDEESLLD